MKFFVALILSFTLCYVADCQGVKGYTNGPAARSRKLAGTKAITADGGELSAQTREIEEKDSALMKLVMSKMPDYGFENEDFHRDQHIKSCLGSSEDDTPVRRQKARKARLTQSGGFKGQTSELMQEDAENPVSYSPSPSSRYRVVATSSSSAIITPREGIKRSRLSTSEEQRSTKRQIRSRNVRREQPRNFDQCLEPKKVGPCRGSISRYWYNPIDGICQEFIFGGCQSNNNNFLSSDDCMDMCQARGSRRIVIEPLISQQRAQYQRPQPGRKGRYDSTSRQSSNIRQLSQERGRFSESRDLAEELEDIVPVIPTTVDTVALTESREFNPMRLVKQEKI